jgi:hypothetical protein
MDITMIAPKARHKLAYAPVPKAACSSVKATMASIDPAVPVNSPEELREREMHSIYPTRRFRKHRWLRLQGYFRFTVVRDPVKRLLSCYTDRVQKRQELFNSRRLRRGEVDLPLQPDPDMFFQNLDAYAAVSSVIKHHVLPTKIFSGPSLKQYDAVYRTDEMDALARALMDRTEMTITIPRKNESGTRLSLDDLKGKTIDALRPRLDYEYRYLGDYYRNPLH